MAAPVATLRTELSASVARFQKDFNSARKTVRSSTKGMTNSFKGLGKSSNKLAGQIFSLRGGLVGLGGALVVGKAINEFIRFEKGLREVGTLMGGLTKGEMKAMGDELKTISKETGQAIDSLVKARYDIVSAGFTDAADSAELLRVSAALAVGGVSDVATTADLLTTAINAYGLEAKDAMEITDKLFTIVRLGKTTITELAGSMGRLLAIAATMNVDMDEVGAALATLTANGQKTEEAITAIRAAIVEFSKPGKALADALKSVGIESGEALIKQQGLEGALKAVNLAAKENGTTIIQLLSNVRSMQAVLPLATTASDQFAKSLEEMGNVAGATVGAVAEMDKALDQQVQKINANIAAISLELTATFAPALLKASEAFLAWLTPAVKTETQLEALTDRLTQAVNAQLDLRKSTNNMKNATDDQVASFRFWELVIAEVTREIDELKAKEAEAKAVIDDTTDSIDAQGDAATKTGKKVVLTEKEKIKAVEEFNAILAELTLSQKELQEQLLDEQIEKFRAAEIAETDIAIFEADRRKQIAQDERDSKVATFSEGIDQIVAIGQELLKLRKIQIKEGLDDEIRAINDRLRIETDVLNAEAKSLDDRLNSFARGSKERTNFEQLQASRREQISLNLALAKQNAIDAVQKARDDAADKERAAAKKLKPFLIAQVIANTAVEASKVLANPFALAAVLTLGAVQIATIKAQPFAKGGIVNGPTLFNGGAGIMGEAGPEAILPLTRINGELGVKAGGDKSKTDNTFIFQGPTNREFIENEVIPLIEEMSRAGDTSITTLRDFEQTDEGLGIKRAPQ